MNNQTIELDIDKRGCGNNCIRIAQGENGGTTIKALVYDNGTEFALAGYTAYLVARLPDRIHYYKGTATVSGNTVTHVCEESKLACVPGYTDEAYFEFTKGSQTVQTERFALDIMRDAREGNVPAQSWNNAVEALEQRAEAAVSKSEKAATDATAAVNNANAAKLNADAATDAAKTATNAANASKDSADEAAADARKAAEEARDSINPDKRIYLTYDTVGDTEYITLVDMED